MPTQVQFRRGTTAQNNNFIGAPGEISVDLDRMVLRVHDGVTAGGNEMVNSLGTVTNAIYANEAISAMTAITATNATNLLNGDAGSLPYQSATGITEFIRIGALNEVLASDGTTATWVSLSSLTGGGGGGIRADELMINTATTGNKYLVVADANGDYQSLEADNNPGSPFYNIGTGFHINNTLTVAAEILPFAAGIDIGSLDKPFRSLYVTSGTVYLGGIAIKDLEGSMTINNNTVVTTATIGALSVTTATNLQGGTAGQLVYQSDVGATGFVGPGTAGEVLVSSGNLIPQYISTSSLYVASAGRALHLFGGLEGGIPYQTSVDNSTFLAIGGTNSVLTSNGNTPVWSNSLSLPGNLTIGGNLTISGTATYVNSTITNIVDPIFTIGGAVNGGQPAGDDNKDRGIAFQWYSSGVPKVGFFGFDDSAGNFTFIPDATITNDVISGTPGAMNVELAGGTTGQLVYQSAASQTGFVGPGTAGQLLMSGGAAIPVYTNTASIYVEAATHAETLFGGATGQFAYQSSAGVTAFMSTGSMYTAFANKANNVIGGSTGSIVYQSAADTSALLPLVPGDYVLTAGATAPQWTALSSIQVFTATNIANGTAGQQPYQVLNGQTGFFGPGTTGQILVSNGTGAPAYTNTSSIYVANADTAIKATNLFGGSAGSIVYQSAADTSALLALGTNGYVLTAGASAPQWTSLGTISASTATNIANGSAGQLVYQSAAGATSFVGPGTAGEILVSTGASAPSYTNTGSIYTAYSNRADNIKGGSAGQLVYNSGGDTTAFVGPGTAGQILVSAGASIPVYTNTGSIYVGNAAVANILNAGNTATQQVGFADTAGRILPANTTTQQVGFADTSGKLLAANTGTQYVGFANKANNIIAGAAGSIVYQSAADTTAFLSAGASNTLLVSNGSTPSWSLNPTIGGNVTIVGNLTVQGTSTYVNSTVTNLVDPIFTIGGDANGSAPGSNDSKDRGIAFQWHTGSNPKTGFFGYDNSSGKFTFVPDATITGEVVSGTKGALDVHLAGGTAGQLVYQSAADTTSFVGPGTAGQLLMSAGASAPVYTNTSSIYVNTAVNAEKLKAGTTGALVYQSAADVTSFLSIGTAGFVLTVNPGATAPQWSSLGTLSASTATNLGGGTAGQIPYQTNAGSTQFFGPGTSTWILTGAGASAPQFKAPATITVGFSNTATNIFGGSAGQLVYQTGFGSTSLLSVGTAGQVLMSQGASAPVYTSTASIYVNTAVNTEKLKGGAAGSIVYQSAADTTAFLSIGTAGQILTVNAGATAPSYTSTGSIYVGFANKSNNLIGGTTGQFAYQSAADTTAFMSTGSMYTGFSNKANNVIGGTAGQLLYNSGVDTTAFVGPGTAGQILVSAGAAVPVYTNTGSIYVGFSNQSNNLLGGSAGQFAYQTGAGATAFVSTSSMYVNSAVSVEKLKAGSTGAIVYQSAADTTAFLALSGTAKSLLTAGASAPVYVTQVQAQSGTGSSSAATGQSLVVTGGGVGVTGDSYFANNLGTAGRLATSNLDASTTTNTANALYVAGGAYIGKTLIIEGDATFRGAITFAGTSTSVASTNTFYTDNILDLHAPPGGPTQAWFVDDGQDIGVRFSYYTASTSTTGALVLANNSKQLEWYESGATGTNVVTNGTLGTFRTGAIKVDRTTGAHSDTTGALQVKGGIGVAGGIFVTGRVTATNFVGLVTTSTNIAGGTLGQLPYQSGVGTTAFVGPGTAGQLLVSAGAAVPVYTNTGSVYVGFSNQSNNLLGGAAGGLPYQTGAGATTMLGIATTSGWVLASTASAPQWASLNSLGAGSATTATHLAGGTIGQIPYQTGAGLTGFFGPGTAGQVHVSGGAGIPVYQSNLTLNSNIAASSTATGALQVNGGAGIGGGLVVGGALTATSITINGASVGATSIQQFTATAGQTSFTVAGGYTVGQIQVFANGVQLGSGDYTASNGTTVVLTDARAVNDIIRIVVSQGYAVSLQQAYTLNEYTATGGQTSFTTSYNPATVQVYVNGVLQSTTAYTASNGTSIVFGSSRTAGEKVGVISFNSVSITNAISSSGGTINGTLNVTGSLQQNGVDFRAISAAMAVALGT